MLGFIWSLSLHWYVLYAIYRKEANTLNLLFPSSRIIDFCAKNGWWNQVRVRSWPASIRHLSLVLHSIIYGTNSVREYPKLYFVLLPAAPFRYHIRTLTGEKEEKKFKEEIYVTGIGASSAFLSFSWLTKLQVDRHIAFSAQWGSRSLSNPLITVHNKNNNLLWFHRCQFNALDPLTRSCFTAWIRPDNIDRHA